MNKRIAEQRLQFLEFRYIDESNFDETDNHYRNVYQSHIHYDSYILDLPQNLFLNENSPKRRELNIWTLAVLMEYIPVGLNSQLSFKCAELLTVLKSSSNLRYREPLITILCYLNQNSEEINISEDINGELFEEFILLDRQFFNDKSIDAFRDFMISLDKMKIEDARKRLANYKAQIQSNYKSESFWKDFQPSPFFGSFLGFIQILNFISSLIEICYKSNSQLIQSSLWHFYRKLFDNLNFWKFWMNTYFDIMEIIVHANSDTSESTSLRSGNMAVPGGQVYRYKDRMNIILSSEFRVGLIELISKFRGGSMEVYAGGFEHDIREHKFDMEDFRHYLRKSLF